MIIDRAISQVFMFRLGSYLDDAYNLWRQNKVLSSGEIKILKQNGINPEELKYGDSKLDLFKDKAGNIYAQPKSGGQGWATGVNINSLR